MTATHARKHTRSTEAKRKNELDQGMAITVEGRTYAARVGDVTPQIARELRQKTGLGFMQLMEAMSLSPDIDLFSAWAWVSRRIDGEFVELEDVDRDINYSALLEDGFFIEGLDTPEAVEERPEA